MNKIKIIGNQSIHNKEIKIIEGGFGENQKCILASDIATQHDIRLDKVNDLIKNNLHRFNENDIKDFLKPSEGLRDFAKENGLITNNRVKNIFLLSERGYTKLVSMMANDNEKKWEVMDKLIDEYFTMRKIIKDNENLQAQLLLSIYKGGQEGVVAAKQLTELEKKPLLETIEIQKPKAEYCDKVLNPDTQNNKLITMTSIAKDLGMSAQKLNKILHGLEIIYKRSNTYYLYKKYEEMIPEYFDYVINEYGQTLKATEKGRKFIVERIEELLYGEE